MEFEFDEPKSRANAVKHGIDFVEALIEVQARTEDEPRFLVVGVIADKYWSAVITYRGQRVILISCRRSRTEEVAMYEG